MRVIKAASVFTLLGFVFLCTAAFKRTSAQQVTLNDEWVLNTSYGFPVRIAFNDEIHAPAGDRREIFIFIEAQHFTPENIRKLFTSLAAEYKKPDWLDITAFSDKVMLQRAINNSINFVCIQWADTPEGRAAAKKWAEEHEPLPSGYYRAEYYRTQRNYYSQGYIEESYSYSPDPAKPEMARITLQGKPPEFPYTGNLNSDLLIAAYEGDVEKVRSLLDKGANVNARREDGDTPLMLAALSGGKLEIVNLLLTKGADVNAKNKENDTALIYAASNRKADILQLLLDKSADINHQNDNGYSALIMAAAVKERLAPLKALLARGADVEAKENDGNTALIMAAGTGAIEMVRALLEKGANVNVRGEDDDTPLIKASANGELELVKLLLRKGANVNVRNRNGVTPLMVARNKEVSLALLSRGADVNAKDEEGATALMYAAKWGITDKAQALLERGADIGAKNKRGETALNIANQSYANINSMLDLLESAEAKQDEAVANEAESRPGSGDTSSQPQLVIKRDPKAQCCEEVSSVAFSQDGKMIAAKLYHSSFAGNHGIVFWDANTGKLIKSIEGPPSGVISVHFNSDGRSIFSEYGEIWDVETGKQIRKGGTSADMPSESAIYSVAFSSDRGIIASAEKRIGERNKISIRDAATGEVIRSFTTDAPVTHLKLKSDGHSVAGVIRSSNTIAIWDADTGDVMRQMQIIGPGFSCLAYSNDGKLLAASFGDLDKEDVADVFDANTGKFMYRLEGHSSGVSCLVFSSNGKLLASGSYDTTVKLWDAASGKLLRTLEGHTQLVRSVAFSPDGRLLISGGGKNETKIWSVGTGKLLLTLVAFNDGNWIAYTPDGYYNCSEGATKYITWRMGKKVYEETEYKAQYFKPEMIAARLLD
jgi:ankyrin repeat protein/WD40 repeat protein